MLFSRSAEYAIRAFLYLAQREGGEYVMARQIAEHTGMPASFLAKLLQQLAKRGLVRSTKGPSGGFSLNAPPRAITLLHVVEAVDGEGGLGRCPLGRQRCSDGVECALHSGWMTMQSRIIDYLERTTIADLARNGSGRSRPARKPQAKRASVRV